MRKCLRCQAEMDEGFALRHSDSRWRVTVSEGKGMFPKEIGKLSCAVCPECGYVELYLEQKKPAE